MTAHRSLQCRCGAMHWQIAADAPGTHVECYCADCQTFARHLGAGDLWLDEAGGTEIFQTLPHHLSFTAGREHLRVLRLGPKGLMRWYAGCCGAPIANTLAGPRFPFVGVILRPGQPGFGPVVTHANTAGALRPVASLGMLRAALGLLARAAVAKLTGRSGGAPFFDAAGAPVIAPKLLTPEERTAARPPRRG